MLSSTGPRERILVIGGYGAGKSTCATDIAKVARDRGTDLRLHVLDTTYEAERNFLGYEDMVDVKTVESWPEYVKAVKQFKAKGRRQDWLVVDRADPAWDEVQAEYSRRAHGKEIDEWFLQYRGEHGKGHAFSGEFGAQWGIIRRMYQEWITPILTYPGNVLVTAKAKPVMDSDSEAVRKDFAKFGVRPAGEGNLGFQFHTTLHLAEKKQGEWVYTTIRDRGREQQKAREMVGFVVSYLMGVAGWKL